LRCDAAAIAVKARRDASPIFMIVILIDVLPLSLTLELKEA
jgi:hypothetical protein